MKARKYLSMATDIPEDEVDDLLVPGGVVIDLLDAYKDDRIIEVEVSDEDVEIEFLSENEFDVASDHLNRCPECGSPDVVSIDSSHDCCAVCHFEWDVEEEE